MKVYMVENDGLNAGEDYFDIVCADSKDEAQDISMSKHATTEVIEEFYLEVTELVDTTCNSGSPRVLSTRYLIKDN